MASLGLPSMAEKEALRKVLSPHPTFSLPYSARSESGSGDVEVEAGEAPCSSSQGGTMGHYSFFGVEEERGEIENFYNCTQ